MNHTKDDIDKELIEFRIHPYRGYRVKIWEFINSKYSIFQFRSEFFRVFGMKITNFSLWKYFSAFILIASFALLYTFFTVIYYPKTSYPLFGLLIGGFSFLIFIKFILYKRQWKDVKNKLYLVLKFIGVIKTNEVISKKNINKLIKEYKKESTRLDENDSKSEKIALALLSIFIVTIWSPLFPSAYKYNIWLGISVSAVVTIIIMVIFGLYINRNSNGLIKALNQNHDQNEILVKLMQEILDEPERFKDLQKHP